MAGRGPAPKDPAQRRRRNAPVAPTTVIASDDELRGSPLPDDALDGEWHPRTVAWWDTWRKSAQAQTFTATDWDFLLDTALMHHTMWSAGRLRAAKFGATPEDRLRLRMQVTGPEEKAPEEKPATRYGHLRAVKGA